MFAYLKLKNYKSLVDVEINFRDKKKKAKNLVVIYGENGAGKSNIASAFYTLHEILNTMTVSELMKQLFKDIKNEELIEENEELFQRVKDRYRDLKMIIRKNKTINSKDNMVMEFGFVIKDKEGYYHIEFDEEKVVEEKLEFVIEKNKGIYFNINNRKKYINKSIFRDDSYEEDIEKLIEMYWGKHTLLSILMNELEEKADGYLNKKVSKHFMDVLDFLRTTSVSIKDGNRGGRAKYCISHQIFSKLSEGIIEIDKSEELEKMEKALNIFFTSLYADIKKVFYKKQNKYRKISYKLFCTKLIGNKLIDIDFQLESTGTLEILDLLPALLTAIEGRTVIIDEFGSGIHDLMIKEIIGSINNSIKGQLIVTTHNTLLMEKCVSKDSIYIIVVDDRGNKEVLCILDYEMRTHPNNNMRSLYLKGFYDGIPNMIDIDYNEILRYLN